LALAAIRRHHLHMHRPPAASTAGPAVDVTSGLLSFARQVPSPNCDDRPCGVIADLVIVHGISLPPGEFGGPWIDRLFTNTLPPAGHPYFEQIRDLRVSSHALIRRDGEVVQYVPFHRRAWHAGASAWQGREACNDYSIGIELEGTDHSAYAPEQYAMLARVTALLCRAYPALGPERLVGHSDVAPGRKSDPGLAFDWPLLRALVRYELEVAPG
jgi:N-acetyl-anhydromuramoyl-L-alanine amidase